MNRSNKFIIFSFVIITITIVAITISNSSRKNITGGIFSKKLTEKTSVSIKDNVENKNNLIYINIDGFSYSIFEKANENTITETQNINELIKRGTLFTNAKTGIPSITSSMQQSIVSGAWPIDTGNCYRYYDLEKEEVVQYSRENKLGNIAEEAKKNNVTLLAINSWYFKENGINEEKDSLYMEAPGDDGFKGRFDILKRVLKSEEIEAYGKKIKYQAPPQFISIYLDELDAAAHNLNDKTIKTSNIDLKTRKEVENKMISTLNDIDDEIGEVMDILKQRGLYEKTTFVITTDHGTVPFGADNEEEISTKDYAYSQMPDLLETISKVGKKHIGEGFNVEAASEEGDKAKKSSDVIVTSPGLQVQVKFRQKPSEEFLKEIVKSIQEKPYYGDHMYQDELKVRGVPPKFADLLITPKPPYHFSHDFKRGYYAVNQHDSLDERVQNIFTMISGPAVKNGEIYDGEIHNIDMAPTMARVLGFEGPKDATASAVDDVLIEEYRGPKLEVLNFKDNIKKVDSGKTIIQIETESNTEISINKKIIGRSDKNGILEIEQEAKEDVNRFIIEVAKDGKSTRRVVFATKHNLDKKQ